LTLLHVFVPSWAAIASPEGYAPPPQVELDAWKQRLQRQLDDFLSEELRGIRVRREVRQGDPPQIIAELAKDEHVDLIAMPTHGYGPFRRFLLGSVTAKVLHDTACPVMTGPHMEHPPAVTAPNFRKILCAVSFGKECRPVLEWGAWMASQFGAQLSVVHAIPAASESAAELRRPIESTLSELHAHAEIHIELGDVPAVVREAAGSTEADLLVIGRGHGHGLLGRLRTNAYAILRESPCPVIAV
jgi:nucleotide-binding universal stress UspA family protein